MQLIPVLRDYAYAVPNGGKRGKIEAARMKGMGVRAGVSDYHLPVPRGIYHGLWIELKAGKGKPTDSQLEWQEKMRGQGHAAYVCTGWERARAVCRWYLALPAPIVTVEVIPLSTILNGEPHATSSRED
jgi:hypothetical protein